MLIQSAKKTREETFKHQVDKIKNTYKKLFLKNLLVMYMFLFNYKMIQKSFLKDKDIK